MPGRRLPVIQLGAGWVPDRARRWAVDPLAAFLPMEVDASPLYASDTMLEVMRLLIIGSGAIGAALAKAIDDMPEVDSFYITDKNEERAMKSVKGFSKAKFISSTDESVRAHLKNVDLVVEAASQDAVKHYVPLILGHGNDVLVMSVGAFADDDFRVKCFGLAKRKGGRLYVPSGAVCGTDHLAAAAKGLSRRAEGESQGVATAGWKAATVSVRSEPELGATILQFLW